MYNTTKASATKNGKILVERLGKGWKLRVWNNLGWNYCAENHPLAVYPHGDCFHCLMTDDMKFENAGSCLWTDDKCFKDPVKAVKHIIKRARKEADRINNIVEIAENIIKGEI